MKLISVVALAGVLGLGCGAPAAAPTANPCFCPPISEYSINTVTTITSPGFNSNQICANVVCKYRIFANEGQHVRMSFNKFVIFGSLTIYNGPKGDDSELIIATLQGEIDTSSMPPLYSSIPKDNSGGVITMVYKASAAKTPEQLAAVSGGVYASGFGFSVSFTTTLDNGCGPQNVGQHSRFSPPVVIKTPNYPYNYPPDLSCRWNFTAPTGMLARVSFNSDANTEKSYDNVVIYNSDGSLAASYSGQDGSGNPPAFQQINGSSQGFQITFSSDDAVDFNGFQATLSGYNPATTCDCGQTVHYITDVTKCQVVTSPNYGPGHSGYCENANCTYNLIVADTAYRAKISFDDFDLERGYDHLTINDGINGFQLEDCTGITCKSRVSDDNKLTLHFLTDSSISKGGFQAHFCASLV